MQFPYSAYALCQRFEIRKVTIVKQVSFGRLQDDSGTTYASVRLFSSRQSAEHTGREWLAKQEKQLAQTIAQHERRKQNVAEYKSK